MSGGRLFGFEIHFDMDLSEEDLWPDGDAPEAPTIKDVVDMITKEAGEKYGGDVVSLLRDWDLLAGHPEIYVEGTKVPPRVEVR